PLRCLVAGYRPKAAQCCHTLRHQGITTGVMEDGICLLVSQRASTSQGKTSFYFKREPKIIEGWQVRSIGHTAGRYREPAEPTSAIMASYVAVRALGGRMDQTGSIEAS